MGILETAREVATLVQKLDNIELVKEVLALQGQIHEVVEENRALKQTAADLEALLRFSKGLVHRYSVYFAEGDPMPLCPKCWEVERRAVHLVRGNPVPERLGRRAGYFWNCFHCKVHYELPPDIGA